MTTQVKIIDPKDSKFKTGDVVDYSVLEEASKKLLKRGKRVPVTEVVFSDKPVVVTFGKKRLRRISQDTDERMEFQKVYIDGIDVGEVYPSESEFNYEIFLVRSAQPHTPKVLQAAERFFNTRNLSISYFND